MDRTSLRCRSDGDRHSRTCGRRGRRFGPGVRRALGVAVVVPVLSVMAVACSGSGGDGGAGGKKEDGQGQASSGTSGGASGDGGGEGRADEGGGVPPLDEGQLEKALLKSGDVKGYRAQRNKEGDALPSQNTMESDDPRCSPITDVVDSKPEYERSAYTSGVLLKGSLSTGGSVQQVLLSSYGQDGAQKWLGELKKALSSCDSFTGKIGTGEKTQLRIKPGQGVGVGDDSVRFTMEDAKGKDSPAVFTVVRTGGNTASFMSVSLSDEPQGVAKSLVQKQHEKLKDAAEK